MRIGIAANAALEIANSSWDTRKPIATLEDPHVAR
jgi:hypothetical protein